MPSYAVTGLVTISVIVEVEADTPEQAREVADGAPMQELCYHCATGERGTWCTSGELDGTPEIKEVRLAKPRRQR